MMSEVKPHTEEKHGHRIDYIQKMLDGGWDKFPADTVRWLLATIEAYKAEVEGARREMEIFLDACLVGSVGDDRSRWPTTPDGEAVARFAKATRALKTTPTGGE